MIGYHYTSLENYWHICNNEGLIPYPIKKPDLPFTDLTGVWLWNRDLSGDEHIGSILWQVMTKSTIRVVKLAVVYDENNLLRSSGMQVEILHDGKLGSWNYHHSTPAVIVIKPILPKHITRLATYNLQDLFRS